MNTLSDLVKWCAMPKQKLQNHIVWCLKRFANFTAYVNHDRYYNHLNDVKYIRYNAVAILVMSFECDKQTVHTVSCTGPTRFRKHKPPRSVTMLLRIGTTLDSQPYVNSWRDSHTIGMSIHFRRCCIVHQTAS
jgi:hypothetical protein